jgi:hypothetical protein
MAERAKFILHKNKKIYFIDYTNLITEEAFLEAIKETNEFRKSVVNSGQKDLLMLVDISNSYTYGKITDEIKRSSKETKPYVKKSAVVGLNITKKILLNSVSLFSNLQLHAFNSLEEAKNWLVE